MPSVIAPRVSEELLEPVRRTLRWLAGLRGADGRIVCPWHGVEHTGSNAGLIVMACELLKHAPDRDADFLRRVARAEARRLVANLQREGTSECHTFRPGRHDPFNGSNAIIDGGACADALSQLVLELGPELPAEEREAARAAALLHARTYLRYAVLDKGVPAQRAWGLTGLAGAAALEADATLESAALSALDELARIQHQDGSFPYHPLNWGERGAAHPGASDVSSFYQSRVSAFTLWALERLGRSAQDSPWAGALERGLEFLHALQGPDGIKCGLVEAKPWYWGAAYEVASHPFDVHALAAGGRALGRPEFGRAALRSLGAWSAHLEADGQPRDHLPGSGTRRSYQCPIFWSGHAMWIARALGDLECARALPSADPVADVPAVRWFAQAQLARLENAQVIAWVRGSRPASNVNHGSPRGAGLLRVHGKRERLELLARTLDARAGEAEWVARAGLPSLARGWRSGAGELRFALWIARVHARAGRGGAALIEPARAFERGVLRYASARVSSAWPLACEAGLEPQGLVLRTALAHRDGTPAAGSRAERRFTLDEHGLRVEERLLASAGLRAVAYRLPRGASDVRRAGPHELSYHLP